MGRLDRERESHFQTGQKIEKISSLNNFEFSEDGSVVAHRQFDIGLGKVNKINLLRYFILISHI